MFRLFGFVAEAALVAEAASQGAGANYFNSNQHAGVNDPGSMNGPPRRSDQRRGVLAFFALTRACRSHTLARGLVRIARQPADHLEELWLLADEQSVIFEGFDSRYRAGVFYRGRANDRNYRELSVEERAGLGHDQIVWKSSP